MSLEDFFNAEGSFTAIIMIISLFAFLKLLPEVIQYFEKAKEYKESKTDEQIQISIETNAMVLYYRTEKSQYNTDDTINYITFQLQNSEKIELAIEDITVYNDLLKGGYGTLTYRGKCFINFVRV